MKIFFACTHANQGTGYARVANKITNFLADQPNVEVVYLAFQNYPGQAIEDRFIDPRIRFIDAFAEDPESPKGFGDKCIKKHFDEEKPDVLFLYNDLPVCVALIDLMQPVNCKVVVYLDIVYKWEDIYRYEKLKQSTDVCLVFLDCWKNHLVGDLGWDPKKVHVLKHGVEVEYIPHAKESIGFKDDDYLVLNLNRNSYRKQWCVTIKAFIKFLVLNNFEKRLKLLCGCVLKTDDGYDINQLIDIECIKYGLNPSDIKNNHIFLSSKTLHGSDRYINTVYSACDVGINTCCGEGFGLANAEHITLGKPQIVAGVPAFKEILTGFATIIEPVVWTTMSRFENHGGEIAHFNPDDFAMALHNVYHQGTKKVQEIPDFPWELDTLIEHVCKV
jgi:glycosyltransferase involved in cell wall biosynthesis